MPPAASPRLFSTLRTAIVIDPRDRHAEVRSLSGPGDPLADTAAGLSHHPAIQTDVDDSVARAPLLFNPRLMIRSLPHWDAAPIGGKVDPERRR